MQLKPLLHNILPSAHLDAVMPTLSDTKIMQLTDDSRKVQAGSLFFAYPGTQQDGRRFIGQAMDRGAAAILYEASDWPEGMVPVNASPLPIPAYPVNHLQHFVGPIASAFYDHPSSKMTVIGVTGTNGKTSCTHYLAQLLTSQQQRCALAGTIGVGFLPDLQSTGLTTLNAIDLQRQLHEFWQQGAQVVAMEVSSHSLVQQRVSGTQFDIAVLTQLSRDHLDYHGSMEAYAAAKAQLFAWPGLGAAVLNGDDALGQQLCQRHEMRLPIIVYSAQGHQHPHLPSVVAKTAKIIPHGFEVVLSTPWGEATVNLPVLGEFNISNVLAVVSVLGALQWPLDQILNALPHLSSVIGRMQLFGGDQQPRVIVDYAHTPDALEKVLSTLRCHKPRRLWCVLGCGGDRDRGKRPLMAQVVERYADHIVLTQDNPRTENPEHIIDDMCVGFSSQAYVMVELDRAAAIDYVISQAQVEDIIVVAGKGHESVQIIGDLSLPFCDQEQVQTALRRHWPI